MTQVEMAQKLGIGVRTLSKIENGHENVFKKVKEKIGKDIDETW
ncbi:helix-turn-helix domain-containing protein [Lederbergia citrea]|nr:helix-turn-helix transcriptional regulator [Lederbergia citrea]MBS4178776.1 helix-turn-helix transcriptional regulator [Lederbergia citrea]